MNNSTEQQIVLNAIRPMRTESILKNGRELNAVSGTELNAQKKLGDALKKAFDLAASAWAKSLGTNTPPTSVVHILNDEAEILVKTEDAELAIRLAEAAMPTLTFSAIGLIKAAANALQHAHDIQTAGLSPVFRRSTSIEPNAVQRGDGENVIVVGSADIEKMMPVLDRNATNQQTLYRLMDEEITMPPKLTKAITGTRADVADPEYFGSIEALKTNGTLSLKFLDQSGGKQNQPTTKKSKMTLRLREENFREMFAKVSNFMGAFAHVRCKVTQILPAGGAVYGELDAIDEDEGMPAVD